MDKLKMHSPDITQQNIDKLLKLFPNCLTEKQGDDGGLEVGIDFDLLKQELSKTIVEGPRERYQLNWPGKKEALLTANAPIAKTLRPCREESVDFDTTENLFIEGDNLEALKLLQETYLGKVKMIYIDPPYNTGKDFIYADNFAASTDEYLQGSGQKDDEGNRLVANTDSNGRFHSDWLSMMYSRLKLARNLLRDDGVIFISIDDQENSNLRKICDEIFGDQNFEAHITWRRRHNQPNDKSKMIAKVSENILVYAKNSNTLKSAKTYYGLPLSDKRKNEYKNDDNDPRGAWSTNPWKAATGRGGTRYIITTPTGKELDNTWYGNQETFNELLADGRVHWTSNGDGVPRIKIYLNDAMKNGQAAIDFFTHERFGSNQDGSSELSELFGVSGIFDNPKPKRLLKSLLSIASGKHDLVMDFFMGSGSFADAVFDINQEEHSQRRFIGIQIPEKCNEGSEGFKLGFSTISNITLERMRRAGTKIKEENPEATDLDTGFRVLKIDSSNMNEVHYTPESVSKSDLFNQVEHIKTERSGEDLLFQVMLDWGVDLSLPIRSQSIEGKTVYFVNDDDLIACFDKEIGEPLIKALTAFEPLRVVFRDDGFVSDSVKINAEQIFKQLSPTTDIKAI